MEHAKTLRWWIASLLAAHCALFAPLVHAQAAGEVEFSRGVGFAQSPGQGPRTLGKGLPLREGDRLTTSDGASAVIKLQDGTRMTVRPNSELVLQQYQFRENAPDNGFLMPWAEQGVLLLNTTLTVRGGVYLFAEGRVVLAPQHLAGFVRGGDNRAEAIVVVVGGRAGGLRFAGA